MALDESESPTPQVSLTEQIAQEQELPSWFPRCRGKPCYEGNAEAFGFVIDSMGRGVSFIAAGAFLGASILRLAKLDAGCEVDPPPGETKVPDCNGRVYGIRPSSLLTTYTILSGILTSMLMPLMGAIVDYTPYRRKVARTTSIIFCVCTFPHVFLNENNWFAMSIIFFISSFVGWAQSLVTAAYLPELTEDKEVLNKFTASFTIVPFVSMILYLLVVIFIATVTGISEDETSTARLGMGIAFVFCSITLRIAWWKLMKPRPAARPLPSNTSSVWTAGFQQIYRTTIHIATHYKSLKWFYIGVMLTDAAQNALSTILITYLVDQLNFSTTDSGITILLLLLGSVPGAVIARRFTSKTGNPVQSVIASSILMMLNTTIFVSFVDGPGNTTKILVNILAFGFGCGMGWKWTSDRLLSSTLIPPGQDAELMGVFLFAGQILTWLPPLIFTGLNELGVSQRIGIASLNVFSVMGIISYIIIGNYEDAINQAREGCSSSDDIHSNRNINGDTRDNCGNKQTKDDDKEEPNRTHV
eukprot:CAMPEP_0195296266 /NCGR_PEP_ID=MMETSP0707-20130614/19093_1 /TAXON_ID=33640 /ORGANISM="Asterionellopsis glacialis, Strain CCMP134" /LENGTH=528 /DNA_ID=CAMNT_0040357729 /DNA_START=226 /DNA_END=1812 /DNA_ORIENTATION=+